MSEYSYSPPEPSAAPDKQGSPDAGVADAEAPEEPSDVPDFVNEIGEDGEMDMTMIMGIVALAFFILVVGGVQLRKMR